MSTKATVKPRTSAVAHQAKTLAVKHDNPSVVHRAYIVEERTDSHKLSSGAHMHAIAYILPYLTNKYA